MPNWILYALISMLFAGCTSVIAKHGLDGISGELGLVIRTAFVFGFVMLFGSTFASAEGRTALTSTNIAWLALSGLTTTLSWIFYYRALKLGDVSTVALIDKGSFVVAVLLAWLVLGEQLTLRTILGSALILAGLVIVASR